MSNTLSEHVKRYQEKRLRRWTLFLIASISLLTFSVGTISSIAWYRVTKARTQNEELLAEHKELAYKWSHLQKSAKELKALTKEHSLLEHNKLAPYLKSVSESIPVHTLLTLLEFKAPETLTLQGYAESLEELGLFMHQLAKSDIQMHLKQSYALHPVIFFKMSTEIPSESTSKKRAPRNQKAPKHLTQNSP